MVEGVQAGMKPCPYCGHKGVRVEKRFIRYYWQSADKEGTQVRVDRWRFYVRCNRCYARGGVAGGRMIGGYRKERDFLEDIMYDDWNASIFEEVEPKPLPGWARTEDQLKELAISLWNRRAEHDIE